MRAGQQDVAAAARHALAHGPLLALRHAVLVLPWAGETSIVHGPICSWLASLSGQVAARSAVAAACCKTAASALRPQLPTCARRLQTALYCCKHSTCVCDGHVKRVHQCSSGTVQAPGIATMKVCCAYCLQSWGLQAAAHGQQCKMSWRKSSSLWRRRRRSRCRRWLGPRRPAQVRAHSCVCPVIHLCLASSC